MLTALLLVNAVLWLLLVVMFSEIAGEQSGQVPPRLLWFTLAAALFSFANVAAAVWVNVGG